MLMIPPLRQPALGDFFVVATTGWKAAVIRWATQSSVNHAGVFIGAGTIMEAESSGAREDDAHKYGRRAVWSHLGLRDDERERIVTESVRVKDTKYNTLDIIAIGLAQRRLGRLITPKSWLARRLSNNGRLICSQLVDLVYARAGVHLFADGRPTGLVTPQDLLRVIDADRIPL